MRGLSRRQLLLLAGSALLAMGLLWVFTRLMAKPTYATLYSGLSASDEQTLAQRLGAENVPFRVSAGGGSLSVPADAMDRVRMQMAAAGLPHSGQMGWEIFDKPNWMGNDFDDQVDYQRALEGELERTILTLNNVEAVRVNLVLGHQSLFTTQARPAKASVVVRLDSGGLSPQQVAGIQHLVAGAVDNLAPSGVVVVDGSDGLVLRSGPASPFGPDSPLPQQLKQKLLSLLTPVAGAGNVRAQVTVDYDRSTTDSDSVTYDPNGQVLVSSDVTRDSASLPSAMGIPGATSNVPGPQLGAPRVAVAGNATKTKLATGHARPGARKGGGGTPHRAGGYATIAAVGAGQGEDRSSEADQYVVSHEVTHQVSPAGRIKSISAAILVNDIPVTRTAQGRTVTTYQPRSASQLAQIRSLAMAAIGFNPQRGDQLTVQDIRFALPPPAPLPAASVSQRVRTFSSAWALELRDAGLLVLFLLAYLLLWRPLQKVLAYSLARAPAAVGPAVPALAGAAETGALPRAEAPPVAMGEALAPALELDPRQPGDPARRAETLKKQLAEVVKKEPDTSSRLLRHWMRSENS